MTNRKNRAMNAVQAPLPQAGVQALPVQAGSFKLSQGDDTMLPSGYSGNQGIRITSAEFCMHVHA
jgi:hypothetical protein